MTAKELESKAWRLIGMAKVADDKARRKALMQEAFDLLTRASALRKSDLHSEELNGGSSTGIINTLISLLGIGWTTYLTLQSQSAEAELQQQANLLDLSHDSIFLRDMNNVISYWSRGAEELYGWKRAEAVGKISHELLETSFPAPLDQINAELEGTGWWEGEIVHKKRDGTRVVVTSRWSLQRDKRERPI